MGLTLLAVNATGAGQVPDQTTPPQTLTQDGLRGSINIAGETSAPKPRLVKASIIPDAPGILPATPVPYVQLRKAEPVEASSRDLECLTRAVYFESKGEPDIGQAAVAQVVLNRTRHPAFPKTVCGVVNQGVERRSCQFSFVCKPTRVTEPREWARARRVAERALDGHYEPAIGTATFFHATRVSPGWNNLAKVGRFGNHVFYRYAGKRGAPSAFTRETRPSLLDSFTAPIQAAFAKPAVKTETAPPTPSVGLAPKPAETAAASPATAVAVGETPSAPLAATPATPAAPAAAPEVLLQPAKVDTAPTQPAANTIS